MGETMEQLTIQTEILDELSLEMDIDICMAKQSSCEDAY